MTLDRQPIRRYLDQTVRTWLGLPEAIAEVPALPDHLARLLLRSEEYERTAPPERGIWEFGLSENFRTGRLWEAEVDRWVAEQRRSFAESIDLEPLWPDGRKFVVCFTHDVDRVSHEATMAWVARAMRSELRRDGSARPFASALKAARNNLVGRPARVASALETLERSVAVERKHGIRASYFFTVYASNRPDRYACVYSLDDRLVFGGRRRRVRDVVRELADDGFDVGLHGSYGSAFDGQRLRAEKDELERAAGLTVSTTRQHWLRWDIRVTPALQEKVSLRADSTVGFNRNVGFRAGTCLPFWHFDLERAEPLDVLQVPLIVQERAVFASDSLDLDPDGGIAVTRQLIDEAAEVGGVATLLFHPERLRSPKVMRLYEWSIEHALERGAWIATLAEIDRWWRRRAERLGVGIAPKGPLADD